jgi:hypothetical protein
MVYPGALAECQTGNAGQAAVTPLHCPRKFEKGFLPLAEDHSIHLPMLPKDRLEGMGSMGAAKDRDTGGIDFLGQGGEPK